MKTVVCFDNFDLGPMTCAVVDGDHSHLHNKFLNSDITEQEADEINAVASLACEQYNLDEWYVNKLPVFPSEEFYEAVKAGAKVIVTGCLP